MKKRVIRIRDKEKKPASLMKQGPSKGYSKKP